MISAALGSKAKRNIFVRRFFEGERPADQALDSESIDPDALDDEPLGGFIWEEQTVDTSTLDEPPCEDNEADAGEQTPRGLRGWLSQQAELELPSDERKQIWQQAVQDYHDARRCVDELSSAAAKAPVLIKKLLELNQQARRNDEALQALEHEHLLAMSECSRYEDETWKAAWNALEQHHKARDSHLQEKPGLLAKLLSLWGTQRRWAQRARSLDRLYEGAQTQFDSAQRQLDKFRHRQKTLDNQLVASRGDQEALYMQISLQYEALMQLAEEAKAAHLIQWLEHGTLERSEVLETAEPWLIKQWRKARAQVFIKALRLHEVFFKLEAKRVRTNLYFITNHLKGAQYTNVSRDAIRSAWATLFMAVPVLSSTFASFARSFGSFNTEEIGWLLVDEAGQATPQAAVGALWRARRAVLVGDPLQLPPILNVSDAVLERMRTRYAVHEHWRPSRQSAQSLADEATSRGRQVGPRGEKRWVGLPLVVHRRCDRPMFELANRIAYDGAMVYGTLAPAPDKETPASLPTGWLQAEGPSDGNWVRAEGDMLKRLLQQLKDDGVSLADISVITPFQDVRRNLSWMLPKGMVYGTIHTMQGKEAPVVVLVLGGNTSGPGARNWAVSSPNLLNVAATRAKRRFYVIGDRNDWAGRSLFCEVMDLLPPRSLDSHGAQTSRAEDAC